MSDKMIRRVSWVLLAMVALSCYSTVNFPTKSACADGENGLLERGLYALVDIRGYTLTSEGDIIYCQYVNDSEVNHNDDKFSDGYSYCAWCSVGFLAILVFLEIVKLVTSARIPLACSSVISSLGSYVDTVLTYRCVPSPLPIHKSRRTKNKSHTNKCLVASQKELISYLEPSSKLSKENQLSEDQISLSLAFQNPNQHTLQPKKQRPLSAFTKRNTSNPPPPCTPTQEITPIATLTTATASTAGLSTRTPCEATLPTATLPIATPPTASPPTATPPSATPPSAIPSHASLITATPPTATPPTATPPTATPPTTKSPTVMSLLYRPTTRSPLSRTVRTPIIQSEPEYQKENEDEMDVEDPSPSTSRSSSSSSTTTAAIEAVVEAAPTAQQLSDSTESVTTIIHPLKHHQAHESEEPMEPSVQPVVQELTILTAPPALPVISPSPSSSQRSFTKAPPAVPPKPRSYKLSQPLNTPKSRTVNAPVIDFAEVPIDNLRFKIEQPQCDSKDGCRDDKPEESIHVQAAPDKNNGHPYLEKQKSFRSLLHEFKDESQERDKVLERSLMKNIKEKVIDEIVERNKTISGSKSESAHETSNPYRVSSLSTNIDNQHRSKFPGQRKIPLYRTLLNTVDLNAEEGKVSGYKKLYRSPTIDYLREQEQMDCQGAAKRRSKTSESCLNNASMVDEMTKRIEYLTKVNGQREKEITKLHCKNDFLSHSLSRAKIATKPFNKTSPVQTRSQTDQSVPHAGP